MTRKEAKQAIFKGKTVIEVDTGFSFKYAETGILIIYSGRGVEWRQAISGLTTNNYEIYPLKPKHKQLCWCWEDEDTASRILRFYDAKNECTFQYNGEPNGNSYNNYHPVTEEEMVGFVKEFYDSAIGELNERD